MPRPDEATIQSLRSDLALQIARFARRTGVTQSIMAKRLGLPQPTLSKIINGRVSDLSIELLVRVAVRARMPLTLQTGLEPEEAGAFVAAAPRSPSRPLRSALAEEARAALAQRERRLTPTQRLEAFLEHNQWISALHLAGRAARKA